MCDIAVVVEPGRVLFAKNSDRDANEAQFLDWQGACEHAPGALVRCTWTAIPQARRTHAVLLSRPFWMWGAEMGANEHGLVAGNVAVFTRRRLVPSGLTGMDLLRLALERACTADEGLEVLTGLLAAHGQGGGCGHEHRRFTYSSSFILADAQGAWLLETAGREWARERIAVGARSVSNGLTIPAFRAAHVEPLRTWGASSAARRACTLACAAHARGPGGMFALLRHHGHGSGPRYDWLNGALSAPCAHAGGLLAATQTTASWVSELGPSGARHWATATAAPCTSVFKPVQVHQRLHLGPPPTDRFDAATLWWRHERLHRRALREPELWLPRLRAEQDALEAAWLARPPEPEAAFAEAERRLARWTDELRTRHGRDTRPFYARHYWRTRHRRAGLTELAG